MTPPIPRDAPAPVTREEPFSVDTPARHLPDVPLAPAYGFPHRLFELLERKGRPPGPLFDPRLWRSPIRGPWLTSVFAVVLLFGLPILIVTGLLSYSAYQPQFPGNAFPAD